jgi:hypothetical protein
MLEPINTDARALTIAVIDTQLLACATPGQEISGENETKIYKKITKLLRDKRFSMVKFRNLQKCEKQPN